MSPFIILPLRKSHRIFPSKLSRRFTLAYSLFGTNFITVPRSAYLCLSLPLTAPDTTHPFSPLTAKATRDMDNQSATWNIKPDYGDGYEHSEHYEYFTEDNKQGENVNQNHETGEKTAPDTSRDLFDKTDELYRRWHRS
ncbi:hypothetical protein CVT25_015075 [Psilocybe cyanescens]|uniref:Uncharacterized protein n=1 Tax=Psilocybe cyanescens TaxID=93625 RepID=A0A409WS47_PSICY|nr:hypothetical protein CVT25_015075 [Psilocybe cyanescens]